MESDCVGPGRFPIGFGGRLVIRRGRFQFGRFVSQVKTAGGNSKGLAERCKTRGSHRKFFDTLHVDKGCSEFLPNYGTDDRCQASATPLSRQMKPGHASFVSISGRMQAGHASSVSVSRRKPQGVSFQFRNGCKLATRVASQSREDASWPREFRPTFGTDATWRREFR